MIRFEHQLCQPIFSAFLHSGVVRTPRKRRQGCTAALEPVGIPAWAPGDTVHVGHSGTSAQVPKNINCLFSWFLTEFLTHLSY